MTEPRVAHGQGDGPTQTGARSTGSGLDAAVAGAALLLSLYGLLVILADLVLHQELVPHSGLAVTGIMLGCLVVGALLGAFVGGMRDRD